VACHVDRSAEIERTIVRFYLSNLIKVSQAHSKLSERAYTARLQPARVYVLPVFLIYLFIINDYLNTIPIGFARHVELWL